MDIRPYFNWRDELTEEKGIVFKGSRCVIPTVMRKEVLGKIHSAHMGLESCLRRAREAVFWPGLNAQVRDLLNNCGVCATFQRAQMKETLTPHEMPTFPWEAVGAALLSINNLDFLVTVDYFSGYWEVDQLTSITSLSVIRCLRRHFARFGIPRKFVSDNWPQFSSEEFSVFTREWGFWHVTSSPGYLASNGKAESAVQIAKNLIRKALDLAAKEDPWLAILAYRNTPTQDLNTSVVQRFLGRRTRSTLPMKTSLMTNDQYAETHDKSRHVLGKESLHMTNRQETFHH